MTSERTKCDLCNRTLSNSLFTRNRLFPCYHVCVVCDQYIDRNYAIYYYNAGGRLCPQEFKKTIVTRLVFEEVAV